MLQLYCDGHYISKFTIYGERHSGTNFLEQCFKQEFGLDITYFFGFKHWFGFTKPEIISYKDRSVLFLGIVRNPYDWLAAFYNAPHHVPIANRIKFEYFLTNEWYSVDLQDKEMMLDRNYNTQPDPIRYKNIFELRKNKCQYLTEIMPIIAKNYVLLSYDSFIKNQKQWLRIIGQRFHLKKIGDAPDAFTKPHIDLKPHIKNIIDTNLDWSVEESMGYFQK